MKDIQYVRQTSQGQAAARNEGLRHVTGQYVCSLDSDDLWKPTFLEECIGALRDLNADLVFANWIGEDMAGKQFQSYFEEYYRWWDFPVTSRDGWRIMTPKPARAMYLDSCVSPSSALVFRRENIGGGWQTGLKIADDWCLILDQVLNTPCSVAFTMKRLWIKRVPGDNIYDKRNYIEVVKELHLHDTLFMLDRFGPILTGPERAGTLGHLAFHSLSMAKLSLRERRLGEFLSYFAAGAGYLVKGVFNSRQACVRQFISRSSLRQARQDPPPAELSREDIAGRPLPSSAIPPGDTGGRRSEGRRIDDRPIVDAEQV